MHNNMNKKIGVVSGKFRILTKGHKEYLVNAMTEKIDELHVIICDYDGVCRFSTIEELKQSISEILRKYEKPYYFHIYTKFLDLKEKPIKEWDLDVINMVNSIHTGVDTYTKIKGENITIFNSKKNYKNSLINNKMLVPFENKEISASIIENNLYIKKYYSLIAPEFMRYINRKYVISGIESSGKTNLCQRLADIFDTNFSEEVGRFYSPDYLGGSKYYEGQYSPKDLVLIAMKQIIQDKDINLKSTRMVFLDSDPVVTLRFLYFYRNYYLKNNMWTYDLEQEVENAELLLKSLIQTYKVDKVFLLEPATFVDDGSRAILTENERLAEFSTLKSLYEEFNINFEIIPFDGDYMKRLNIIVKKINEDLNIYF